MVMQINRFCQEMSPLLQLVGLSLNIFKITLPVILIVLGVLDISKAVISSKSEDVKKNMKNFFKKVAVCIMIFFVPSIVMIIFGFVQSFNTIINDSGIDYDVCYDCMFKPTSDNCTSYVELQESNS